MSAGHHLILARAVVLGLALGQLQESMGASPPAAFLRQEGVATLLTRVRAGGRDGEQAARDLAHLEPSSVPQVLGLLSGSIGELGPLPPAERELLHSLVLSWPSEPALTALLEALPADPSLDERLTALTLVGEVGGPGAIKAVVRTCVALAPELHAHPLVMEGLERALVRILRNDPGAHGELRRLLEHDELGSALTERAAAALGTIGRARGLQLLEWMLGREERLDRVVLAAIGELEPFDDPRAVAQASNAARRYLLSVHPELRRQAALALGSLEDGESVPELLDLLKDGDARVRRSVGIALSRISGLDASTRPEAWMHWFEGEVHWFETEGETLHGDLGSPDRTRVVAALRILSMHPLHRAVLSEEIQALLPHDEPAVAAAACAALARLRDVAAFSALLVALEDEREVVRKAAHTALMSLTGTTLGPEPRAWRAWLHSTQA